MSTNENSADIVIINYEDLLNDKVDLKDLIEKAYGFDGLGALAIKGVPNLVEKRKRLLPLSHKFANLPEETKNKTVHEQSFYSFGWSHGKEKLEGKPDYSKGSYYANPQFDEPFDSEELIQKFPSFCHPNIWPTDDVPELQSAFKELGQLIVNVGLLLAKHCDNYIKKLSPTYTDDRLHSIIEKSKTCKARLLHYFPLTPEQLNAPYDDTNFSGWCGWHNDHGSLTGLVVAMYLDSEGKEVPNPDPKSGLYIRSRRGDLVKVSVPNDHLLFQIGEASQIHSGGAVQATPHCVRGAQGLQSVGVSRETFAVFMEPMWDEIMNAPNGVNQENVAVGSLTKYWPTGVPLLGTRWKNNEMTFNDFSQATFQSYY